MYMRNGMPSKKIALPQRAPQEVEHQEGREGVAEQAHGRPPGGAVGACRRGRRAQLRCAGVPRQPGPGPSPLTAAVTAAVDLRAREEGHVVAEAARSSPRRRRPACGGRPLPAARGTAGAGRSSSPSRYVRPRPKVRAAVGHEAAVWHEHGAPRGQRLQHDAARAVVVAGTAARRSARRAGTGRPSGRAGKAPRSQQRPARAERRAQLAHLGGGRFAAQHEAAAVHDAGVLGQRQPQQRVVAAPVLVGADVGQHGPLPVGRQELPQPPFPNGGLLGVAGAASSSPPSKPA